MAFGSGASGALRESVVLGGDKMAKPTADESVFRKIEGLVHEGSWPLSPPNILASD